MRIIIILLALVSSTFSYASVHCKGIVNHTWIQSNGLLLISTTWSPNPIGLCNVSTKHHNIEPDTCKTWASIALAALTSKKSINMQYYNVSSCSDIKSYSNSQQAHYFMMNSE